MYYLYILSNKRHTVLYAGITGHLYGRVRQHKKREVEGFTKLYQVDQLVYYEEYQYVYDAILREKQIKRWRREKKEWLIGTVNSDWNDLSAEWY